MNQQARKRKLEFDLYAKNLGFFDQKHNDIFGCPICRTGFRRGALNGENPAITLGHIDPKSAGGKRTVIECRECNNRIGTDFEHVHSKESKLQRWCNGEESITLRGSQLDKDVAAKLTFAADGEQVKFEIVEGATNPTAWDRLFGANGTRKLNLPLPEIDPNAIVASSIHTAFLLLFYHFGYEYVLQPNIGPILDVLNGKKCPSTLAPIVRPIANVPQAKSKLGIIHIMTKPEEMACFFVVIQTSIGTFRTVSLPGFGPRAMTTFTNRKERDEDLTAFRAVSLSTLPPREERLTSRKHLGIGHAYWKKHVKID